MGGPIFGGRTPNWNTPPGIVRSGEKYYLYYTAHSNVTDHEAFSDLIRKRIFFIAEVCSLYDECETICTMLEDTQCEIEEKRRLKLGSRGSSAR